MITKEQCNERHEADRKEFRQCIGRRSRLLMGILWGLICITGVDMLLESRAASRLDAHKAAHAVRDKSVEESLKEIKQDLKLILRANGHN